jgi:predicted transcriptional regulator
MTADPESAARHDSRDETTGRFAPKFDEQDILDAVREHEPAATREIAETVGCTRQSADYRLRRLEEGGRVRSKKVGPTLVWIPADE